MKKGNPRFFCEYCGAEVQRNAKNCPSCGRRFGSVRCPKCEFTADESLFAQGCPNCGYSAKPGEWPDFSPPETRDPLLKNGPLPVWVYVVTVFALVAVAGIFLLNLFK